MRVRFPLVLLPLIALVPAVAQEPPRTTPLVVPEGPRSPADEAKGFHLPPGFEAQLVASEPDIAKPLNLAFDAHGRLWVTSTLEYPYPAPAGREPRDGVYVLDDFGPDGKARKVERYAGGLNIPIGLFPLKDGVIVHTIPEIDLIRGGERHKLYGTF